MATVGKLTNKVNVVVLVTPPPVVVTVMVELPAGVEPVVLMVNVEEQVGLQLAEENEAAAPEGKPATAYVTGCVLPDTNAALIVLLTEEPAVTDTFPELLREKSKGWMAVRVKDALA